MPEFTTRESHRCHGGTLGFYRHASAQTRTDMGFAVFTPPAAEQGRVPALYFLAGLTCTEETFVTKAGALRLAAELGLMLVAPDTSPRGLALPGEDEDWDFGTGAGFYLDATEPPWRDHYRMASYINIELVALIEANFSASNRRGIFGHSMGGHGALVAALRNPAIWQSVSAIAPIAHPAIVPWGEKAFSRYLGHDRARWAEWDAAQLMRKAPCAHAILVDQGLEDPFLTTQLRPEALDAAAAASGQLLTLRRHEGYDHSYWFIQSVIDDHLHWHARHLSSI